MISYNVYKLLHLAGIFTVLLSLGASIILRTSPSAVPNGWKRFLSVSSGVSLVVVLVAGFGLLARLGISWSTQGWVYMKMLVWLFVGALPYLLNRFPGQLKLWWWSGLAAACIAAYMATIKPF